jgi:hypothetical protein
MFSSDPGAVERFILWYSFRFCRIYLEQYQLLAVLTKIARLDKPFRFLSSFDFWMTHLRLEVDPFSAP